MRGMLNSKLEIDLRSNSVAFLTTIFPAEEAFLIDFFNSLCRQTFKDFDVIVINDGNMNFEKIKIVYEMLNIIEIKYSDTPSKNRQHGINYCIDNRYDVLIFGDSDDYFASNRVELSLQLLEESDIVVNDVSLFNENGIYEDKYFSHRLDNLDVVDLDFIKDKNIFGLSNTAIKLENISKVIFDDKIIAVDWYFFKILLKQGLKAVFTNEIVTYYRQYDNNIIGLRVEDNKYYLWWEKEGK
jgi:glycosyltransferase involved in cell wall biosynthesis